MVKKSGATETKGITLISQEKDYKLLINTLIIITGILSIGMLVYIYQTRHSLETINKTLNQHSNKIEELNEDISAHEVYTKQTTSSLDSKVFKAQNDIDILNEAVHKDERRDIRINKIIAAIKQTLPGGGNPLQGCRSVPTPGELDQIAKSVIFYSNKYAVEASLILAIIRQESAFCNEAVSSVGARGYMQIMPLTAVEISNDLASKEGRLRTWIGKENIHMGTAYISWLIMEFEGDIRLAVGAYNGGPNHIKKVMAELTEEQTCKDGRVTKFYCQTDDYITKVLGYKELYDKMGIN